MRVKEIEVENYRSIEQAAVDFDRLTAIVGRNGAGKSTLLNAIGLFYNLAPQLTEHDYFDCDTTRAIKIRVTFSDLSAEEKREFASYLDSDLLTVTKVITTGGMSYRGVRRQVPEIAAIRSASFRDARARLRELIESGRYEGLAGAPRSQAELTALLDEFERTHPALLQPIESESMFLGPTNIGGGKLDKYTKFVRIPAVRDAAGEIDRRGAILQLLDVLVLRSVSARPEIRALNEELERRIREIFSKENLTELDQIARSVTALLERYAPGAALELEFGAIQAPKVPTPQPVALLVEDQFKCPISFSGHGLQRALIFALLEQLARTEASQQRLEVEAEQQDEAQAEQQRGAEAAESPPHLILAIEEPELYLHPPRSRFLARTLMDLATANGDPSTQVCYTTHSPFFVGLDRFDQIRLARKQEAEGTATRRAVYYSYSRQAAATELQGVADTVEREFTAESFYVRTLPVMTCAVSEGFFADIVVVVEGISDVAALTAIQELTDQRWDEKGIVVVPAIGKANIDRPVLIFRGLRIPTYFLFDGDANATGRDRTKAIELNHRLQRLAGVERMEDFPPSNVHDHWAVFAVDLEEELRGVDAQFFLDTRLELAREYGFPRVASALKNPELTALYVRRAHENGRVPEILYEVVSRISRRGTR